MSLSSFFGIDTYIAFGLIGIVIVIFLLNRLGVLPKKSIPYVAGAMLALFGIHIFREWRSNKLRGDIEELEKQIKEKEKNLKKLKEKYGVSDQELQKVTAELERLKSSYEQTILQLKEKNKELKQRIDGLTGEDLHNEFRDAFGTS